MTFDHHHIGMVGRYGQGQHTLVTLRSKSRSQRSFPYFDRFYAFSQTPPTVLIWGTKTVLSLVVRIGENSDKKQPLCDKLATTVANIATDHVGFFLLSDGSYFPGLISICQLHFYGLWCFLMEPSPGHFPISCKANYIAHIALIIISVWHQYYVSLMTLWSILDNLLRASAVLWSEVRYSA